MDNSQSHNSNQQAYQQYQAKYNHQNLKQPSNIYLNNLQKHTQSQNNPRQITNQNFLLQYLTYFQSTFKQAKQRIAQCSQNLQQRKKHKIIFLNQNPNLENLASFRKPSIYIIGYLLGGILFKYQVIITNFKISLDLLNLNFYSQKKLIKIGHGGYGNIYKISYDNKTNIIAKRIKFKSKLKFIHRLKIYGPTKVEIQETICEYAIYVICSFFKIGPKVITNFGFDLICFEDSIQFYIQQCGKLQHLTEQLQFQLKINIRILHQLKIIHKDIKPDNILYSHSFNNIVLTDFGISHSVQQQIGQKTKSFKEGTLRFMSKQMKCIQEGKFGFIDLYFNDLYCLKTTMSQLDIKQNLILQNIETIQAKSDIYVIIHWFYLLINKRDQSQLFIFTKQQQTKRKDFLSFVFQKQLRPYLEKYTQFESIFLKHCETKDEIKLIKNLIRCYGLTDIFMDELKDLKQTEFIRQLKKGVIIQSLQDIEFQRSLAKLNKKQPLKYGLQREIKQLQMNGQKFKQTLIEKYQQLFMLKMEILDINDQSIQNIYVEIKKLTSDEVNNFKRDFYRILIDIFVYRYQNQIQSVQNLIKKYPEKQCSIYQHLFNLHIKNDVTRKYHDFYITKLIKIYTLHQNIQKILHFKHQFLFIIYDKIHKTKLNQIIQEFQSNIHDYIVSHQNHQNQFYIKIYTYLGFIQRIKINIHQSLSYYQLALELCRNFNGEYSLNLCHFLNQIGLIEFQLKNYNKSLNCLKKSMELMKLYSKSGQYDRVCDVITLFMMLNCLFLQKQKEFNYFMEMFLYQNELKQCLLMESRLNKEFKLDYHLDFFYLISKQGIIENINNLSRQINLGLVQMKQTQKYSVLSRIYYQLLKRKNLVQNQIKVRNQKYLKYEPIKTIFDEIEENRSLVQQFFKYYIYIFVMNPGITISKLSLNTYVDLYQKNKVIRIEDKFLINDLIVIILKMSQRLSQHRIYIKFSYHFINLRKQIQNDQAKIIQITLSFIDYAFKIQNYWICIYYCKSLILKQNRKNNITGFFFWKLKACYLRLNKDSKTIVKIHKYLLNQQSQFSIKDYLRLIEMFRNIGKIEQYYLCMIYLAVKLKKVEMRLSDKKFERLRREIEQFWNNNEDRKNEEDVLKRLKLCKMSMRIKMRYGCFKYIRYNFLRQKIGRYIKFLN